MYLTRLIEKQIEEKFKYIGAIQIEGPKWCGKSTTAARFSKTIVKLQNPIVFKNYQMFALTSKEDVLFGEKPILFDEWQKIPEIWDFVRLDIDEHQGDPGRYILTGSAKPIKDDLRHSGAGRIVKIKMRPMSLFESKHSNGIVSISSLFDHTQKHVRGSSQLTIENQVELVCRSGFPGVLHLPLDQATSYIKDYYHTLIETDINDVDGVKRDSKRTHAVLKTYARNISTLTTSQTMLEDISNLGFGMERATFNSYVEALEKLFVLEDIEAWTPKLRSKTRIRTSAKKQFVDPSLAVVALGATKEELMLDMETFGFFFESLVIRDLRVYMDALEGNVYHYRDKNNLEVDVILKLGDDRWAAIEIKVGGNQLDQAAKNLLSLANKIDEENLHKPEFLMIIYGGKEAYVRPDGVYVVPIGCLKD